ncbi:unnamed protein product [Phytophthora fragariaefolia]|uniref:Unnamed protein product n=1 Tax=Phytophthora fragariaefolia TaxID=1490495 RepID=A0A9W6Y247_9STRA|nr:unnamed protein product [Phytophthora fragariaefolia]
MKLDVSSLLLGLLAVGVVLPMSQVAAQGDSTSAPLVAPGVLENRTVTTSSFVNETTTVVTSVLRTEEEVVEEEDGDASVSDTPDETSEPPTDDVATYLVNETTIVVTTVQGYRNVTTSVITLITPTANVASDDTHDDGVKELLDTLEVLPSDK